MTQFFSKYFLGRSLLVKCIAASLTIHAVGLYLWMQHPMLVKSYLPFLFSAKQAPLSEVPVNNSYITDVALEEFFKDFFPSSSSCATRKNSQELLQNLLPSLQATKQEPTDDLLMHLFACTPLAEEKINVLEHDVSFPSLTSDSAKLEMKEISYTPLIPLSLEEKAFLHSFPSLDLGSYPLLENDCINLALIDYPTQQLQIPEAIGTSISLQSPSSLQNDPGIQKDIAKDTYFALPDSVQECLEKPSIAHTIKRGDASSILSSAELSSIDDYLSTQVLYNMQWNDSFTVAPTFFTDDEGYIFSLTVSPKETLASHTVKQNVYFLIDVSSEIENHKITVFKRSVLKALSSLQAGDYFNIFLLDKKIVSFSPSSVPFSFHNLRLAEDFLEKKRERAIFSSFHLFQGLNSVLNQIESSEEMHTAILLTNGKISSSYLRKEMGPFLEKNQGKISLFSASVGKNNDLVHLDMISSLAGGKLLYSDTNASFPRKLSNFVKNLHGPIAKDIRLAVRTSDPKAEVTLLPRSSQPSNLYSQEPFIIMGKTNRLCPLEVTLEGKNEEGWILIQKETNFSVAEEATNQIKKEWALRQVSSLYEEFLEDGEEEHLEEAKSLLKMMHGRTLGE